MRIAQLVTLVSPDGAYGGPVRVAVNQLKALASIGHDVHLFSTYRGFKTPPNEVGSIPLTAFPAHQVLPMVGFSGIASGALLWNLRKSLKSFDVLHVHLARDLVTLPAARLAISMGVPVVAQTHGMIDPSTNPLASPLDAALTRPVLSRAATVLYLTDKERGGLESVAEGRANLRQLANGVPEASSKDENAGGTREVLFVARLQARKRPLLFVSAALQLSQEFPDVRFTLVGPDQGEAEEVGRRVAAAGSVNVSWEGPLAPEGTLERMRKASIYVLPSINEPFPMSVLEAASVGLPLVVTDSCGLAPYVDSYSAGRVIDDSLGSLVAAIRDLLCDDSQALVYGKNARRMVATRFSMDRIAEELLGAYQSAPPVGE